MLREQNYPSVSKTEITNVVKQSLMLKYDEKNNYVNIVFFINVIKCIHQKGLFCDFTGSLKFGADASNKEKSIYSIEEK